MRSRGTVGFIEPCLPRPAKLPPSGPGWIHEIKHDGFRLIARRDAAGVRLITRKGNDFTSRFPFIAMAVAALPARSCLIDGEAIVCDENGLAVFDLIRATAEPAPRPSIAPSTCSNWTAKICGVNRSRPARSSWQCCSAALIRRSSLTSITRATAPSSSNTPASSAVRASCRSGCGSPYRSGRTPHWVKVKNPKAPAVTREAEEDWS